MPKNARFWCNVTLIGLAHVAVIYAFVRSSREAKRVPPQSVVWMNGGGGAEGAAVTKKNVPPLKAAKPPRPEPQSKVEPPKELEPEEDRLVLTSAKSEIQLPTSKPSSTSTATATPARSPRASPSPKIKVPPRPTPKPKPKPTPKPTPSPKKLVLAKATPKPSPKVKLTPEENDETRETAKVDAEKKKIAKAAFVKNEATNNEAASDKPAIIETGSGKGTSTGAGVGHAGGSGSESAFGWYGSMLHDRFYSEWVQPTTAAVAGAKNSVLAKLRIERDGRVSKFEIIKPSGNAEVDESVGAVAKRITQVDPLPPGLGNGEHYDVKINFELNSEQ